MRLTRRILMLMLGLAMAAPALHALEPPRPMLRAALFDVAPYARMVDGAPQGLHVEKLRALAAAAGYRVEIELMPFARLPLALESGAADLTLSFGTAALERVAVTLGTVAVVDSVVVSSAARAAHTVEALRGAHIGRARGGCQDLAQREELGIHWVEINGFDGALRMLARQRLDGLCLTREVLGHYAPLAGVSRAQLGPEILVGRRPVQLFCRYGLDPEVVARLRGAVAALGLPRS